MLYPRSTYQQIIIKYIFLNNSSWWISLALEIMFKCKKQTYVILWIQLSCIQLTMNGGGLGFIPSKGADGYDCWDLLNNCWDFLNNNTEFPSVFPNRGLLPQTDLDAQCRNPPSLTSPAHRAEAVMAQSSFEQIHFVCYLLSFQN